MRLAPTGMLRQKQNLSSRNPNPNFKQADQNAWYSVRRSCSDLANNKRPPALAKRLTQPEHGFVQQGAPGSRAALDMVALTAACTTAGLVLCSRGSSNLEGSQWTQRVRLGQAACRNVALQCSTPTPHVRIRATSSQRLCSLDWPCPAVGNHAAARHVITRSSINVLPDAPLYRRGPFSRMRS